MTRSRGLQTALVLAVTGACLGWVLWGLDHERAWGALVGYRVAWLVPCVLLLTVTLVLRTVRFQALLGYPVRFGAMFSAVVLSFVAINVVPLRLGELVRPYLLAEKHEVPVGASLAAVVVERILDSLALLALISVTSAIVVLPQSVVVGGVDLVEAGRRALATTAIVGLAGVVGLGLAGPRALAVVAGRLPRVARVGQPFVDSLAWLGRRPVRGITAVGCTAGNWLCMLGVAGCAMAGMPDLEPTRDRVLLHWTSTVLGTVLFPTPGSLGAFEAPSVAALSVMGVDRETATGFSFGLHALLLGHIGAFGAALLAREGLGLASLVRASQATVPRPSE